MLKVGVYIKKFFPKLYNKLKNSKLYKLYHYKYIRYMEKRRLAVQNFGYYVIRRVTEYSEDFNSDIWIDAGTLLGYVREGQLLKHDYDIDFGMLALSENKRIKLINDFSAMGFERVRCVEDNTRVYCDTFCYKGVIFDINYYTKENNCLYYLEYDTNIDRGTVIKNQIVKGNKIKYIKGYDTYKYIMSDVEFCKGKFTNGCICIIPKNPQKRVEEMYGMNWQVPIIDEYIWTRDTENEYLGFRKDVRGWNKK